MKSIILTVPDNQDSGASSVIWKTTEKFPTARMHRDSLSFGIGAGTSEMMRELITRESGLMGEEE